MRGLPSDRKIKTIVFGAYDGAKDGWSGSLPLKDYPESALRLDLRVVRFVTPTFLLRLRAFVEWHCQRGRRVQVIAPRQSAVANYMARMRIGRNLPDGASFVGLPQVREGDQTRVLIPITTLVTSTDVDVFAEELGPLLQARETSVAVLADPIAMAISELCGNAVDHGRNAVGCLVAAQRYKQTGRVEIAIGDLGVGMPSHMRRRHKELGDDPQVVAHALQPGITGTDDRHRGRGFYWVFDEAKEAQLEYARLEIRSGRARVSRSLSSTGRTTTRAIIAPNKNGTWMTYELGPRQH